MDIALNNSAIDTRLTALFNILILGIAYQFTVDGLPGLFRQGFDVFIYYEYLYLWTDTSLSFYQP
jgi:hypothetical protein